jgi:hypothetical protein
MLWKARLNWPMRLSLCLILPVMSGCATALTGLVPLDSYCAIAQPLGYDGIRDTPETVAVIEAHNSKWVCLCDSDCPQKGT